MLILTLIACALGFSIRLKEHSQMQRDFVGKHHGIVVYYHELENDPTEALPDATIDRIRKRTPPKRDWPGPAWLRNYLGDDAFATIAQAYVFQPVDKDATSVDFGNLANLKLLHITNWENLAKVDGLGKLKRLDILRIDCCKDVKDYSSFAELKQLGRVNLKGCQWMTELPFSNSRQLEQLSISYAPRLAKYEGFGSLPSLRTVNLQRVGSLDFSSVGANNISNMTIQLCPFPARLKGISKFQNLENLTIVGCPVDDVSEVGDLKKLSALSITSSYLSDFSPIGKLTELKLLSVPRNPGIRNLDFIANLSELETLSVAECSNLINWDAVFDLKQLKVLDVTLCRKIERQDVDELKRRLPNTEVKYLLR